MLVWLESEKEAIMRSSRNHALDVVLTVRLLAYVLHFVDVRASGDDDMLNFSLDLSNPKASCSSCQQFNT